MLSLSISSGSHDSSDDEFANFEVDADFLLTLDHQIAVRQYLRHHAGDIRLSSSVRSTEPLPLPVVLELAVKMRVGHRRVHDRHFWFAEEVGDAGILSHRARAFGFVFDIRLVGDVDLHRKNVADWCAR